MSLNRRDFLKVSAAASGGLLVGVCLPGCRSVPETTTPAPSFVLHAFVEVDTDGVVTIMAPVPEIGQGVRTALPMIVAEELDVAWDAVRVVQAEAKQAYGSMAAAGSDSVADYWDPLRRAGATARALLVAAAAQAWGVDSDTCTTANGIVLHPTSGRRRSYGELAEAAARLPALNEEDVSLKPPSEFEIIGRRTTRVDLPAIVDGTAQYGMDISVLGLLYAVVERSPADGARVASVHDDAARAVPGVRDIIDVAPRTIRDLRYGRVKRGVAVLAESTWAALQGREALTVTWDEGPRRDESEAALRERFNAHADQPGQFLLRDDGDVDATLRQAAQHMEATYALPLLAHVCMEPMNFTAHVQADRCDLWGPTQTPRTLQAVLAIGLDLPNEAVHVHPTLAGGGFGRRLAFDYGVEAAMISREAGAPVQIVWTREDDVRHDYYRTASHHRLRAGLDAAGTPIAWYHHVLSGSLNVHIQGPEADPPALYDVQGAADVPYGIEHLRVEYTPVEIGLQLGSWRSVAHSFNVFAVESFLDEIAAVQGIDPVALRRRLLGTASTAEIELPLPGRRGRPAWDPGRLRRVLDVAAERAGWGASRPDGSGYGVACCWYKQTYAAHVADVSVDTDGQVRVRRIVTAIDCGQVVNPDGVRAQAEGAAMDGVATVLKWGLVVEDGRVRQSNFHDYPMLRIGEAPVVEVHIVSSTASPSGAGEPPYPAVPPAITSAIFDATGTRVRRLPVRPDDLRAVHNAPSLTE